MCSGIHFCGGSLLVDIGLGRQGELHKYFHGVIFSFSVRVGSVFLGYL